MHSEDLPEIEILNEIVTLANSANKKNDINQIINKLDITRLIPPFNESQDAQIKEILNQWLHWHALKRPDVKSGLKIVAASGSWS